MQLSKFSYYSDFFIYPVVCVGWSAASLRGVGWGGAAEWFCALVTGVVLWTLLEYVLHRIALHRMAYFSPLHGAHHSSPLALIGTPTWLSVLVFTGTVFLPAWPWFEFSVASALVIGVMLGYWWYGIVHHVIHHHAERGLNAYFSDLCAWHMRHHYSPKSGNFGVTTGLWDHVFRTAISTPNKAMMSP
jgi:sterol desaturase/sphingolipid hydroxylase (fatty acid hydroxylase superfamily)